MRKRIFEIIEIAGEGDLSSKVYDIFMVLCITVSLLPLMMKQPAPIWTFVDKFCVGVFIIDYLLRWITADYKFALHQRGWAFARYPFSAMALIDLMSILPSLTPLNQGLKVLRIFRMVRALRVFRAFRALRYSKSMHIIMEVIRRSRESLLAVCTLAGAYILISALIIFNVEPDSFKTFFEAVYWATVSLTTVGYGDIYPVTTVGRVITMISSMFGIAIVALPAGIITAGYMKALEEDGDEHKAES